MTLITSGRSTRDEASGWPEYERVCDLVWACDGGVYRLAQPRASMQTPGLPDAIVFHTLRGGAMVSVKHGTGRETKAQREFHAWCDVAGWTYLTGGVPVVRDWLGRKS